MTEKLTLEQQLAIISKAWGNQRGYAFFPWIAGDAKDKSERIQSYHEGRAFKWPKEKMAIVEHMKAHRGDDLYWCPSLFEKKRRLLEYAMDEHALWADLDKVDPRQISEYEPTTAWETSPNRYQALWIITSGDLQGASWPGKENQRLTYYLGADPSGWDTTQLLRIPGWPNHKPEYRERYGKVPRGKLLWANRRRYLADDFEDLPEVVTPVDLSIALDDEIDSVDRQAVWSRVRLKLSSEVRALFSVKEAVGNRSEVLWRMERELADVGCTVTEIVALIKPTAWNKYVGRQDEIRRLVTEASKAVAARDPNTTHALEEERELRPKPVRLGQLLREVKAPQWLVKGIWAEASCGFVAGQPKTFKSWLGLDLALSVSTGSPFLGRFDVVNPGPVLYVQEEDPLTRVKSRVNKIWPGKRADRIELTSTGPVWVPPASEDVVPDPDVAGYVRQGLTASSPEWQAWLDEVLNDGFEGQAYKMIVLDPLMMIAGEMNENQSNDMTERLYKPLKQLSEKHQVAIVIVHHMKKGDPTKPQRGGQLLLGSVANHAWSEDALYVKLAAKGNLHVELESKNGPGGSFKISNVRNTGWTPRVAEEHFELMDEELAPESEDSSSNIDEVKREKASRRPKTREGAAGRQRPPTGSRAAKALDELGPGLHSTKKIADAMGVKPNSAYRQLTRLAELGKATKKEGLWQAST